MVRFKVIHASHVLLALASALLVAALLLLAARGASHPSRAPAERGVRQSATAAAVFAAAGLSPRTGARFQVEVLSAPSPTPTRPPRRVLIYHTHTHEAYEMAGQDVYEATEAWRTADKAHSVVRVGEELATCLERLGIEVTHDVTDHEPPRLGTAYARSLETLRGYDAARYDLYIDLHRDAWDESMAGEEAAQGGAGEVARLMMLVGNGDGFEEKPDTQANLALAERLTAALNDMLPGLARPVRVKSGRYNQHMNTPSLLIEVGHNRNTLAQALAAMPYLARAIEQVL